MTFIRVTHPSPDTVFWENQLTTRADRTNTIQVVERRMPMTGYIIIGEIGNKQTESATVLSISDDTLVLQSNLRQSHTQATNIYSTYFKNLEVYRTVDGVKTLFTTEEIQWSKPHSIVMDRDYEDLVAQGKAVTYSFSFINASNNRKTTEQPAYIGDEEGFTFDDRMVTVSELFRELRQKLFGSVDSEEASESVLLMCLNSTLDELNRSAIEAMDDEYFFQSKDINVVSGKANYTFPSNVSSLLDVRLNGCTIARQSLTQADQTCANGCDIPEEEPVVDPCACEVEPECPPEPECPICRTIYYWQITQNEIILMPAPENDGMLSLSYYGLPSKFSLTTLGTYLPDGYREALMVGAMFQYYFYYKKDEESAALSDRYYARFSGLREVLKETLAKRPAANKPQETKMVKGRRAEFAASNSVLPPANQQNFSIPVSLSGKALW